MKYGEEVVKRVAESVRSRKASAREIERTLGISRRTVGRWVRRLSAGLPARLSRSARRVWNRTEEGLLERLRALLGGRGRVQSLHGSRPSSGYPSGQSSAGRPGGSQRRK